jgi:signal transduction histidine kinase
MIRNALDHGIESPEKREAKGKDREGVIRLSAEHKSGRIIIQITDDGNGINRDIVRKKAIEKGLISPDQELTGEEIDNLIVVLEKLLQIAEAECSTRRQPFEQVSVAQVITNLLELYDAAAEELGISITTEITGEPYIDGDKDLLAGIIANLIDNALKYAGSPSTIKIAAAQHGDYISLIVQDNGPGIPVLERQKVVQKFYRLNRETRGSGLGLSIVAAFTQLHGGSMDIEDADPGFRVRITLPLSGSPTLPNGNESNPL